MERPNGWPRAVEVAALTPKASLLVAVVGHGWRLPSRPGTPSVRTEVWRLDRSMSSSVMGLRRHRHVRIRSGVTGAGFRQSSSLAVWTEPDAEPFEVLTAHSVAWDQTRPTAAQEWRRS